MNQHDGLILNVDMQSEHSSSRRAIIAHYHIYKAGGTTIVKSLGQHFMDRFVELDRQPDLVNAIYNSTLIASLTSRRDGPVAFSAHRMVANIHLSDALDVTPIVFVRHPLLRAVSSWRFSRLRTDPTAWDQNARDRSFSSWIDWCLGPDQVIECRNYQTRMLSLDEEGQSPLIQEDGVIRGDVATAINRLDAMPEGTIGVVEEYSSSIKALNSVVRSKFPNLEFTDRAENSTRQADRWEVELATVEASLPKKILSGFYKANLDDLSIWERCRAMLLK